MVLVAEGERLFSGRGGYSYLPPAPFIGCYAAYLGDVTGEAEAGSTAGLSSDDSSE